MCKMVLFSVMLLASAGFPRLAPAAEAIAEVVQSVHRYTPVKVKPRRDGLRWPGRVDREALVRLQFNVGEDGRPVDIEISEDGFYEERFVNAAKANLQTIEFEPATLDGKPVKEFGLRMPFLFHLPGTGKGVTKDFREELEKVVQLIDQKDFAGAHAQAQWMLSERVKLVYEYETLQATMAITYARLGELHRALVASRSATRRRRESFEFYEPGGPLPQVSASDFVLDPKPIGNMLRTRFTLAGALGFYYDAVQAHALLQALAQMPANDPSMAQFNQMLDHLAHGDVLLGKARIDENDEWHHDLYFGTFGIRNVAHGTVHRIEVYCAGYTKVLDFSAKVEWTIPGSWHNCRIRIRGTPGTEFSIVEFRNPVSASNATEHVTAPTLPTSIQ